MSNSIVPLKDRVLIQRDVKEYKGSLIVSDTTKMNTGSVKAIGPDVTNVNVGDKVIFGTYDGHDIPGFTNGDLIMREDQIIGVLCS